MRYQIKALTIYPDRMGHSEYSIRRWRAEQPVFENQQVAFIMFERAEQDNEWHCRWKMHSNPTRASLARLDRALRACWPEYGKKKTR